MANPNNVRLNEVLAANDQTSGQNIVVTANDAIILQPSATINLQENVSEPGGPPDPGHSKMWVRADSPNTLRFTDDSGADAHLGLYSAMVISVRDFGAVGDGVTDDTAAIQTALDAAALHGGIQTVIIPPGNYVVTSTINHPPKVAVRGAGSAATYIQQQNDASPVWVIPPGGNQRAHLSDLRINGQPQLIDPVSPTDGNYIPYLDALFGTRSGVGLSLRAATFVTVRDVEIWDFEIGIDLADGTTAFSGYNMIGPQVGVNRCDTGVQAIGDCNSTTIFGSRVYYCYGLDNVGVAVNVNGAGGLTLMGNTFEASDCCLRIRADATDHLQVFVASNYLEPATNPRTGAEGSVYDIVVEDLGPLASNNDGRMVQGLGNVVSGNRAFADLRPSSIHQWDGPSSLSFGARYSGAAQTKRNLVRNGGFGYYNPTWMPDWTVTNLTFSEDNDFVTGVRSLRLESVLNNLSSLTNEFDVGDRSLEWITIGVRYKVESGAFRVTAQAGANNAQRHDEGPLGVWKEMHVTIRRPPNSATARVQITPDWDGMSGGVCYVDEVWAVAGRFAVEPTQYGERVELLDAPITISGDSVYAGGPWGLVDILDLPAALPSPLGGLATAPAGVIGGIFKLSIMVDAPTAGILADHNWLSIRAPGAGPGAALIPATHNRVTAIYGNQPAEAHFTIRATQVQGELNRGDATLACHYAIQLVGWILR